ncbi:hypothetical protein IEQ34_004357 [Dendrobium chrysotoxum]|uniref:NADH-ubiquinone reductase complex 1 MLRQ subunit n=1 Tax=Dendrobium chrysotoxum TaxID=161865 RepID=A0AAV7HH31_DENCH|nr:hypothetical protein IEQ34_004357 [Dendrobium chrysotoxum]
MTSNISQLWSFRPPSPDQQRSSRPLSSDYGLPDLQHLSTTLFASLTCPMAPFNRWLRPEVYPLFAAVGTVVGVCVMQLVRNITSNPDVRVLKEKRTAGVLDNRAEGEKYREHGLRKYVRNKPPQIMPSVNGFFSKPD